MKKILWISPYVPYDTVPHAGGKNHNYYLKYFQKTGLFDIRLLTFAKPEEVKKIDLDSYGIKYDFIIKKKKSIIRRAMNIESTINPFNRFGGGLQNYDFYNFKKLINKHLKETNRIEPDIVILQWTEAALMLPYIKTIYKNSKYVIIEEDVTFLGKERKVQYCKNWIKKKFLKKRASIYKKNELDVLNKADLVITLNKKDTDLLIKENITRKKIITSIVYFENRGYIQKDYFNKNIIFYGAMNRKENYLSAIWFIEHVMPLIKDKEVKFFIIGGNPNRCLKKYETERVKVVGFVEDIGDYFQDCLCLVAPLVLGAGIKVKILEALSAGVCVLTNNIGIEGIEAQSNKEFFLCNEQEEYVKCINILLEQEHIRKCMGKEASAFIKSNYNIDAKLTEIISKIVSL